MFLVLPGIFYYNVVKRKNQYLFDFVNLGNFAKNIKEEIMAEKKSGGFVEKLATFIVDKRNLFFLLYIFAFVFCLFSMNWV